MLTFISCAKTMAPGASVATPFQTEPQYINQAKLYASAMASCSEEELMDMLHVSGQIAGTVRKYYTDIVRGEAELIPAILAYTGAVFKRISPKDFSAEDFAFTQEHLRITSFLYGLLRPLDLISPYRLEGNAILHMSGSSAAQKQTEDNGGKDMFSRWRPVLTDGFISEIRTRGGILVNLASEEMKDLFDWKRVCSEVSVVRPEFRTRTPEGKLKTIVIYAKMCRGEMTRMIIRQQIQDPEALKGFCWEGFCYDRSLSTPDRMFFVKEA